MLGGPILGRRSPLVAGSRVAVWLDGLAPATVRLSRLDASGAADRRPRAGGFVDGKAWAAPGVVYDGSRFLVHLGREQWPRWL